VPTIHQERGLRFIIYLDDHVPAHVHVWHAGLVGKIQLGVEGMMPSVADAGRLPTPKLRQALRIVEANQAIFLEQWRLYHGS